MYVALYGQEQYVENRQIKDVIKHDVDICLESDFLYAETLNWVNDVGQSKLKPLCVNNMSAVPLKGGQDSVNQTSFTVYLGMCTNLTAEDIAKQKQINVDLVTKQEVENAALCKTT